MAKLLHNDVLTAVQMEIERHRVAPLLCRLGFHKPSRWWLDFYAHVQVRKCHRCGCAVEARDSLRISGNRELIELHKEHGREMAEAYWDQHFRKLTPGQHVMHYPQYDD